MTLARMLPSDSGGETTGSVKCLSYCVMQM